MSRSMSKVETLRRDLVGIVNELHTALGEIGSQDLPQSGIVSNTRDRLHYIASLTEQSASQTLHAAERIGDRMRAQRSVAIALLGKVRSPQARGFLRQLDADHEQTLRQVSEIIEAQAFQDLVGQVVNKLMTTMQRMEASLAHLLMEADEDAGLLAGPQLRREEQVSQAEIDNLFD